jgi:hypothetical protein
MPESFLARGLATRYGPRNQEIVLKDMNERVFALVISAPSLPMVAFDVSSIFACPSTILSIGEHLLHWSLSSSGSMTTLREIVMFIITVV